MYTLKTLKNGVRLLTIPMRGTETATALFMVGTGSKYENKQNSGISHFLEHMFFKGTKKRPTTLAISGELDTLGGVYNAFTSKEYTGYWAKTDADHIGNAMEILSDMLLNSKFSAIEMEREKGVIIEELNMYRDNPMMYIEDLFENLLYGDQPAGWDVIGTKETIKSFGREDFIKYLKAQYGAKNMILCVAGKIKNNIEKDAEKLLAKISKAEAEKMKPVKEAQKNPELLLSYKKTDQAHLSLGVRAYPSGHPDEYILKALSLILGGGMSSRLFINLREREGLAYYVRTNAEFYVDHGYLTTQAGVPVDKIQKAIKIIINEYEKMKKTLVGEVELNRVKEMVQGRLVIQLEASDNMANWYARQVVMNEKIITPKKYLEITSKITSKDIKRVANDIFANNRLNLAIIGPYKEKNEFLKDLTFSGNQR